MKELLRTNNPVLLSWVPVLLRDAGIHAEVLDMHMSIADGSIGAIPRRIVVGDADYPAARRILADTGDPDLQ